MKRSTYLAMCLLTGLASFCRAGGGVIYVEDEAAGLNNGSSWNVPGKRWSMPVTMLTGTMAQSACSAEPS